jgi:hypothetical protein
VARWRASNGKKALAEKPVVRTMLPPTASGIRTVTVVPFTWKRGRMQSPRSLSDSSTFSPHESAFAHRFAWLSRTPFGLPVVPEV